ncbi:MAG: class I SAM-dependent methyltransferase [Candidatus Heimdallarchaeota archaeon]|nr:class I SAM-dependent methyltransferase [Candidatus Heimdallarchaeota archaeon]MCK4291037.1 class I SAM-dependent methyltransferase [Candidatus Heimdallarchaeota archaeon]
MREYYSKKLSANKLKRCYDIASPRIKQYLKAEINFVLKHIHSSDTVLELGCGYGRVLRELAKHASKVVGIDTSFESLELAKEYLLDYRNIELHQMNANSLNFKEETFDTVIAIQNGISAFKVEPEVLLRESLRITKKNGKLILSSYSENFWEERLKWFILQSEEELLGEIDYEKTGNGFIVCKDGFIATTFSKNDFQNLLQKMNLKGSIQEIDLSSIFCIIRK